MEKEKTTGMQEREERKRMCENRPEGDGIYLRPITMDDTDRTRLPS